MPSGTLQRVLSKVEGRGDGAQERMGRKKGQEKVDSWAEVRQQERSEKRTHSLPWRLIGSVALCLERGKRSMGER